MKRLLLLLLLLAALAALLLYAPLKDGGPLIHPSELEKLGLPKPPAKTVRFYRWKGPTGAPQFTTEPPPAGTPYETVDVLPDANLIPAPSTKSK